MMVRSAGSIYSLERIEPDWAADATEQGNGGQMEILPEVLPSGVPVRLRARSQEEERMIEFLIEIIAAVTEEIQTCRVQVD